MPKYKPTEDDMYSTKPCWICGKDVLDEDNDVCSEECQHQKEMWEEDMDYMMMQELDEDDWEQGYNYWEGF